jgi:hypothetical protein
LRTCHRHRCLRHPKHDRHPYLEKRGLDAREIGIHEQHDERCVDELRCKRLRNGAQCRLWHQDGSGTEAVPTARKHFIQCARRRTHPELQSSNGYMRRSQSTVTRDVQIRQACARISTTIANRVMLTNATRKHNDTCSTMLTIATAIAAPAVRACAAPYLRRN